MPSLLHRSAIKYATVEKQAVLPLKPRGKETACKHGSKDATTDTRQIDAWFKECPNCNIGLATGLTFFVVDVDPRHGGDVSLQALEFKHGKLPETRQQITGGGGRHFLFAMPDQMEILSSQSKIAPGIDIKGAGGYIVAAPSVHPDTGAEYSWDGNFEELADVPILPAPAWLLDLIAATTNHHAGEAFKLPERIKKGQQHSTLFKMGCAMRRNGCAEREILAALLEANQSRCEQPGPRKNIEKLAASICRRYPAGGAPRSAAAPEPAAPAMTLAQVEKVFQKWLYLPNTSALRVTLATVAANLLEGDALWLLLVGATGSGKTELLDPLRALPYNMHAVGTLTEAALLSGSPRRDRAADASGGLLRSIGDFGFLLLKDFTSVLAMGGEIRGPLLAALREIHDGHWTRHMGSDGGRKLPWSGKCALIGGCTPAIDQHHAVMAVMGERFLLMRMPASQEEQQANRAMQHISQEKRMRDALRSAVCGLFKSISKPAAGEFDAASRKRIAALATFVAHARSAVERDRYHRDIELIPDSEMPGRLAVTLRRLFHGLEIIGAARKDCWKLVVKVALDCVPDVRRKVLVCLAQQSGPLATSAIAEAISYPSTTTRRVLEDLTGHRLVQRSGKAESNAAHKWQVSSLFRKLLSRAKVTL